jgi:carbonic anhydrase/acetyltransferase-like protein (isoleucine patch superfamily)
MEKTVKFIGIKVNCISDLRTLDISVQHAELNGRFFSRHKNFYGTIGGFVEKTAKVAETAYIGPKALVLNNALVYGDAKIYDNAWVSGHAEVFDDAKVYGDALVSGNARVSGGAEVYHKAKIFGNAQVYGNAQVSGGAHVYGEAQISENAKITCDRIGIRYNFTSTAQVEEYLKDLIELKDRLDAIGAKSILRK